MLDFWLAALSLVLVGVNIPGMLDGNIDSIRGGLIYAACFGWVAAFGVARWIDGIEA